MAWIYSNLFYWALGELSQFGNSCASVLGNSLIILLIISYHLFVFPLHLDILLFVLRNSGSDIYVVLYILYYVLFFLFIYCL